MPLTAPTATHSPGASPGSSDRRLCIALRYYADLTVPQIAARTGWPEGTVKSRLHHALRDLRVTVDDASLEDER
jgi:DNA-directed RNA polymerase specialized sigma24 family protein